MKKEEGYKTIKTKPFLKWAGGKRAILKDLKRLMPAEYNNYYEPFCGGAALFFSILPESAILSDSNRELINCYKQVAKKPHDLIEIIKPMKYDKEQYFKIRSWKPKDNVERAARFIYLNRCCWNGLYRVNSKGEFNVPFGKYKNPHKIFDENVIINDSYALKRARLLTGDFIAKSKEAQSGDFIYFDPPYTVKHGNNSFLSYNEKIFSWKDQERLTKFARKLADKGVMVMISNANAKEVIDLYKGFKITPVSRTSIISGVKSGRGKVTELIITTYQIDEQRSNL